MLPCDMRGEHACWVVALRVVHCSVVQDSCWIMQFGVRLICFLVQFGMLCDLFDCATIPKEEKEKEQRNKKKNRSLSLSLSRAHTLTQQADASVLSLGCQSTASTMETWQHFSSNNKFSLHDQTKQSIN